MEFFGVVGFTVVMIVAIVNISDIIKKRYQYGSKLNENVLTQMQADLNELKKDVAEMKEYLTDLYIQQHDDKSR